MLNFLKNLLTSNRGSIGPIFTKPKPQQRHKTQPRTVISDSLMREPFLDVDSYFDNHPQRWNDLEIESLITDRESRL